MQNNKVYIVFSQMFPKLAEKVNNYIVTGPIAIRIFFKPETNMKPLNFLWESPDNWTLGTKLWRKPPKKVEKAMAEKKNQVIEAQ